MIDPIAALAKELAEDHHHRDYYERGIEADVHECEERIRRLEYILGELLRLLEASHD